MEGKYLRFSLGTELYGIDILKIVEIFRMVPITHVPHTPPFVKGVINLRGSVVPVIDLRLKIGMEQKELDDKSRIVIVEDEVDNVKMRVGLMVDSVDVVNDVKADEIESAPSFGENENSDLILSIVKAENCVYLLLNLAFLMAPINKAHKKI